MGKPKGLSDSDKDQIMMARQMVQNTSKTAGFWYALENTYQKCSKEG